MRAALLAFALAAAQADFDAAYELQAAPSLLYWKAEARFRSGDRDQARRLFEEYLVKMPAGPQVAAAKARQTITPGDPRIHRPPMKMDEVVIAAKPKAAKKRAKKPPPAPSPPPAKSAPRNAPTAVAVAPPPAPPAAAAPRPVPPASVPGAGVAVAAPSHTRRNIGLAFAGRSIASAVAGTVFAVQARSAANDITQAAAAGQPLDAEKDAQGHFQVIITTCGG